MRVYLAALRNRDFRRLWIGALISLLGDGATWTALAWIAVTRGGASSLAVLGVCYSAPVIVGGLLAGKVVDRFSRRRLLVFDSVVRSAAMLTVPVLFGLGELHLWNLYAVAAVYGLFKILPIGIVPAVLPDLVPAEQLDTAIALEAIATGAGGLLGPALGGAMIAFFSPPWVLLVDAASYLIFAAAVLSLRAPLAKPAVPPPSDDDAAATAGPAAHDTRTGSWRPVLRFLLADRVMLVILVAFTSFNAAMGMLIVAQPWLAHYRLAGGAQTLGVIVGGLAAAEIIGSVIAGAIRPAVRPMLRIGVLQVLSGSALLLFLHADIALVLAGELLCGIPAMLLTVSSQSVRYQRTPEHLRARTMTLMRTLMLGAAPVGSAIAGPLLAAGHYTDMVLLMVLLAGAPGLLSIGLVRNAVIRPRERAAEPSEPSVEPALAADH